MTTSALEGALALDAAAQDLLFREARTAYAFTDEPVTDEQARAIYDLVKWAPTSMNMQPLRIVYVRSPEARARLVSHMADGNKGRTASAPLTALLAVDTDFHEHLPRTFPHFPGAKEVYSEPEGRIAQARFNGALQIGYFIIGVRAAGLAAGPMTGFDAAGIEADFFPDGRHHALAVVNIGRPGPEAWRARNPRLETDEVVTTV
ncbi:malonic semialdehyde reductase [Streptosporangiaceae bacterium NEAU-GS5]|nr:malonic semialdehyde reductase [Streptosporangiaceae bacterium NEAU-GS5]